MEPIPAGSLYDRLEHGRPPAWLRPIPTGDPGSRLYEVVGG